jgi:pimeloyl-ACP methyl ester carboxylesterase
MTDAGIGDALVIGWSLGWPIALYVEAARDGVVGLVCVDGAVVHWTEEIGPFFDSPEQFLADVERRGDDDGVRRVVDNWDFDTPAQWARARCPVLYVLATRHPPEVVAMHRRGGQLRAEQHGATHVREIDASHAVPLDAPQSLAQLIADFAHTSSSPAATHWGP